MDVTIRGETFPLPQEATAHEEDSPAPVARRPQRRIRGATTGIDPLTGALARAALDPGFAAARRHAASVGILLIDIDHFKSINDAFGHAAGDAVLREFGVRARMVLRAGDLLIRNGGDEFVVVLPNAKLGAAHEVAERLLTAVNSRPFPGAPPLTVTLSVGCSVADATTSAPALSKLLEQADAHLYQAKRQGRNQVISAMEAPSTVVSAVEAADADGRLIERDTAFGQMLAWLDGLPSAERGLLRVLAVPGVGLTRFLGAVEGVARLRGYQVLALAGSPALRLRRYGALAEARNGIVDGEPPDHNRLLAWARQADAAGIMVIVDRISEIDIATLELLWQMVAQPGARCIGLVVGMRPGLAEVARLPDLPLRAEIRLQPFSLAALRVWLRGVLYWEAPPEFSAWLYAQTDGYPAHLRAAIRQLTTEGMLGRMSDGAGWQVSPFVEEYPLRDWLFSVRAGDEKICAMVRPYGQLVGRSTELRALRHALATKRVVVLSGHGGVGKTHLALQAAAELGSRYADGATVVHLAAMTAGEFLPAALVRALGLAIAGRQEPREIALEYLAKREMLVVFDSVEHLREIGALVQGLVAAASQVRLLVTTRDAAIVPADLVLTLQGLTMGSALFLQESSLPAPDALPGDEAAAIERICRQVRGYPLAIKMLASWTSLFSPGEIAERLAGPKPDRAVDEGSPDLEIDSSPMQAVFDVFWTLLSERDRQCIGGLALFRGGFTVEAAIDVAGVTPFLLAALRDRAFVQTATAGRYFLHELLRQYAWTWLTGDPIATAVIEKRHATWYAGQAAASAKDMRGPRFRQWVERLEAEMDNLRLALTWALVHAPLQALQTATDLTEFWLAGIYASEGHHWIDAALVRAEEGDTMLPASMRMRALGRLGRLERQWGDVGAARVHLTTALTLTEGDPADSDRERAYSLGTLANIESDVGAHDQALSLARRALTHARRVGSAQYFAETSSMAVWPFVFAGAFDEAASSVEEGLQASISGGDDRSTANLTNAKATIAYYDPARCEEAIGLYHQVIELYEALRDWSGLLLAFNNLAGAYVESNHYSLAAHAYADARRIGRRVRQHRMMSSVLSGSGIVASVRGDDAAAWGFWCEAIDLAVASKNMLVLEECMAGLAYVWARAGFAAHAAVLLGLIGLQPEGKPWLVSPIERAATAARSALVVERWESLLAHGSGLDLSTTARLLPTCNGPYDVPASILPAENLS
jgi:diguanylate cyclase (GGDEF)-like protein